MSSEQYPSIEDSKVIEVEGCIDFGDYIAFLDKASPLVKSFVYVWIEGPWTPSELLDSLQFGHSAQAIVEELERIAPHFEMD